jgi:hypothetical protein
MIPSFIIIKKTSLEDHWSALLGFFLFGSHMLPAEYRYSMGV